MGVESEKNGERVIPVQVVQPAVKGDEGSDRAAPEGDVQQPLESELEVVKAQADEYLDQLQRTAAQFANYKKRIERERSEFAQMANATLITRLLPILDDFERAFENMPASLSSVTWIEGLGLIYRKLQHVLEQEQVEAIETAGERFDPQLHQAVTSEEADGFEEGQIIAEVQKGYRLGERVLRPSMVRVAR
jgi:molecular chaperone GrpE